MLLAATIFLVLLTSASASLGNALLKAGASGAGKGEGQLPGIRHLPRTLRQPAILSGMAVYGISQLLWITVLRLLDLSLAYPLQIGLNFTVIMFVAWFYFKEPISRGKLLGIGMIFAGIVVVAAS
jgi:multidrug transporter EmrE-like cation transporter